MRSFQTEQDYIPDSENYSDLQVLRSAAGFYVGTTYLTSYVFGEVEEPGSRDSGYFATKAEARAELEGFINGTRAMRENP